MHCVLHFKTLSLAIMTNYGIVIEGYFDVSAQSVSSNLVSTSDEQEQGYFDY